MGFDPGSIVTGKVERPPRILIFGPAKIGKSTFAASAPDPLFVCTEDGADEIDAPKTPLIKSYDELMDVLRWVYAGEHNHKTVVLDSADWAEQLVHAKVRELANKPGKEDVFVTFGRGYTLSVPYIEKLVESLNAIRLKRDMNVVVIGHYKVKRYEAPDTDPYERYQLDMHEKAEAVFRQHMDAILFANYKIYTKKVDVGFNQELTQGVSRGERVIYTEERPAYVAGNRYKMPHELPLSWEAVEKAIEEGRKR